MNETEDMAQTKRLAIEKPWQWEQILLLCFIPDHQYDASVIPDLTRPIQTGEADAVFGSRMLGGHPMDGGMPWWKYVANIFLTALASFWCKTHT